MTKTATRKTLTIENIVTVLAPGVPPDELLLWPPDAFAVVAFLLQKSGSYIEVVRAWPPGDNLNKWSKEMRRIGMDWRTTCEQEESPPPEIRIWWSELKKNFGIPLSQLSKQVALISLLIQILAASDEACAGIGIPDESIRKRKYGKFDNRAWRLLYMSGKEDQSTVAERIDRSLLRVLPKMHTPQSGITIRSLSHHLALCSAGEVNPKWVVHPPSSTAKTPSGLNLLLLPWPVQLSPLDFRAADRQQDLKNMPKNMGFFSYKQKSWAKWPSKLFKEIIRRALAQVGRIDGVILPELALKSEKEFDRAFDDLSSIISDAFFVSGVGGKSDRRPYDKNEFGYRMWIAANPTLELRHMQGKHHRWRLDESQIRQYGLTHRLDPYMHWWENTNLSERKVHFCAISPWLTIAALICEDLARQDPVADVLRAVGPNLLVALLMDGPQLQKRWSARYATVFADDPGCSVLCLTSSGMANLSNAQSDLDNVESKCIVGLWKDARGPARQIELQRDCDAIVLSLNREYRREWSADGRDDGGTTAYLTFGSFHNIKKPAI
jgi:hypothetical protein